MAHFVDKQRQPEWNQIAKKKRITGKGHRVVPGDCEEGVGENLLIIRPAHPDGRIDHVDALKAQDETQYEWIPDKQRKDEKGGQQEQVAAEVARYEEPRPAQSLALALRNAFLNAGSTRERRSFHGDLLRGHASRWNGGEGEGAPPWAIYLLTSRPAAEAARRAAGHRRSFCSAAPRARARYRWSPRPCCPPGLAPFTPLLPPRPR